MTPEGNERLVPTDVQPGTEANSRVECVTGEGEQLRSAEGEQLLAAIRGMRTFLGDLSQLLQAAETFLEQRSWKPASPNCLVGVSIGVKQGRQWLPGVAFRRYKHKDFPGVLAQIALLLDDFEMDYRLSQPVITGSYFVLADGTSPMKVTFMHSCWFDFRSVALDGNPLTVTEKNHFQVKSECWQYMQVFGRPLVEVTTEERLQTLITEPLLQLIQQHWERDQK